MLTGIIQLGEYLLSKGESTGGYQDIIENFNDKGNYGHILKLSFIKSGDEITYQGINYEPFSSEKIPRYAYKRGSSRGGDCTPISKLTETGKTLEKIRISLKDILNSADKDCKEYKSFKKIERLITENKEKILQDLEKELQSLSLPKNQSTVLTIVIWHDGEEKYLGDMEIIRNHLNKISDEQYYSKYNTTSKGVSECYYCKEEKEVFGFVNTYNFYTVDKIGFVAGGFKQENAWKNYPVCSNCAQKLNLGKKYVNEYLTSSFAGFRYSIMPKLVFYNYADWKEIYSTLEDFEQKVKFSTSERTKNNLLKSEKDFIGIMADSQNSMSYNMLIFREEQSGNVFRILLYIEDIIPSRLKNILRVKEEIEDYVLLKDLSGKNGNDDMKFGFDKIRFFFPNSKTEGDFDKSFLEILNNVFTYRPISYSYLMSRIMTKLRELFVREEYLNNAILQGLMCILFIDRLGLFNDKPKGVQRIVVEKSKGNEKYLEFFKERESFFDADYKKAVFLLGILVDRLLSIQYTMRGSKPFYSRLNGLKLNEGLVKRIYQEAINKLNECDMNYYRNLELLIGEYMTAGCELSDDDISFYFALGMSFGNKFKDEQKENKGGMEND